MKTRTAVLDMIDGGDYGPVDHRPEELPRFVAVSSRNEGRSHGLDFADTMADALKALDDGIGDWYPVAVIDLDTGDEYEVETKLVTTTVERGEWLDDDDACPDDPDGLHHVGCGCENSDVFT